MATDKDYCYKFVNYLLEKKVIVENKIEKVIARQIYVESFKPINQKTQFSFSDLCHVLERYKLIDHDKKYLVFKSQVLNSSSSGNSNGIIGLMDFKCNICQFFSTDKVVYERHLKTDRHLLLHKYVHNEKLMVNAIAGIRIEVEENNAGLQETFILRLNEESQFQLKIMNSSGKNYHIVEVIEMIPRAAVTIHKGSLPLLKNGTFIILQISTIFYNVVYAVYPLIFRLQDVQSGKVTDVLKELVFHIHSSTLDDLHVAQPYIKQKIRPVVEIMTGVIRGEHMKKNQNDFVPLIPLPQFQISDNLVQILNNGFNDFDGMTKAQGFILRDIRSLLHNFKFTFKEKLTERNYFEMLRLLLFLEEYQMKIDIQKYSLEGATLLKPKGFQNNCLELQVPGLSEHRPSLLRGDSVFVKENKDSSVKFEGIVHKVQLDSVILGFSSKFTTKVHLNNKKYYITFGFNRIPLRAEHQSINLMNQHRAISVLCNNIIKNKEMINYQFVWFNKNIENNEEQQQAVRNILAQSARPMPYLIFGPPGTGKTVTIVEAVLQVWKLLPANILICAPSNNAADEVTKRLTGIVPQRDLIRYIAPSYPFDLVYKEVQPYVNYRDNDYYHPLNSALLKYRIVVTTLVNASRLINGGTPKGHFEFVFIDEGGQATESESLIPIAGILTAETTKGAINGQIVLAGDPKQLGPIIHSAQAIKYKFGVSMLERLMNDVEVYQKNKGAYNPSMLTKLLKSYRSHPAILEVPNKLFYHEELISSADKAMAQIAIGWEHLPNPQFPVIFHSVEGKDDREQNSPSFFNLQEIEVTLNYLGLLIGNTMKGMKISEEHIGIIAPYRKQVFKLQQACNKKHYGKKLFIGSVEQFQGQERLIIIVTTVRSRPEFINTDAKFHLGFLKNPKRFNVAITRAKALLIVIGNPKILLLDPNWNAFIKHCKNNGSSRGMPFNLEPVSDITAMVGAMKIDDVHLDDVAEEGPNFARGRI